MNAAEIDPISGPTDSDFISKIGSQSTFYTIPNLMRINLNVFLNPEKVSSADDVSLIHITKNQFLEFVELMNLPVNTKLLSSKYSESFLFYLKLSSNWSFDEQLQFFALTGAQLEEFPGRS